MSSSRNDAELMVIAQPDWWSRLLALGALLVAAAALYWTFLQERDVKPQERDYLAEINTAVNDGISTIQTEAGLEQQRLADYAREAIQRSELALAEQSSRSPVGRRTDFEEPLEEPAMTSKPPASLASDLPAESAGGAAKPDDLVPTQPTPGPDLRLVYSALRPSELISVPTVTVRNAGDLSATITAVRFIPMSEVDGVPLEVGRHDFGSSDDQQLVIQFTAADNQAENPRAHGIYEQSLPTEYRIAPGGQANVFVMIRNSQHVQYGLHGRLVFYCTGDQFSYDDVTIPFVEAVGPSVP